MRTALTIDDMPITNLTVVFTSFSVDVLSSVPSVLFSLSTPFSASGADGFSSSFSSVLFGTGVAVFTLFFCGPSSLLLEIFFLPSPSSSESENSSSRAIRLSDDRTKMEKCQKMIIAISRAKTGWKYKMLFLAL